MKKFTAILILIAIITSCDYLSQESSNTSEDSEILVANVGNSYLFKADIANLVSPNTSEEDSARITEQFVQNWVKKELLIKEATDNIRIDQTAIERKVADYRYTLLSYEYQKLMVQQRLDTGITQQEIADYYRANQENFILRQNIFRGKYMKVNQQAPKKNDIRRWIKSTRPQDLEALREYAFQFADNYSFEDSTWLQFDDVLRNSPFSTITNKVQFLRNTRYAEETDSLYLYLLKIDEYKISNELSPLEFVKEDIRNIILNKRKVELAKNLENQVFENAIENEDYKIYR